MASETDFPFFCSSIAKITTVCSLAMLNLLLGHPCQERVLMGKSSVFQDAPDSGLPDVTHSAAVLALLQ